MMWWLKYYARQYREEDNGNGNGNGAPPVPAAQTFTLDYVKELRAENKSYRLKLQDAEGKLKTAEEAVANAAKVTDEKVGEANTAASERILRAELKVAAKEAGLIDMDGLKLADLTKVSLKDDGTIEGAEALFKGLKESKPYLFGAPNSASTAPVPPVVPPVVKLAKDMDATEYAAAKAALIK